MDVLIKATKEPLSLTLCIGDYTRVQCDTLVNYILPGASDDSFKLTFHNKGRDDGGDFEKEVKASLSQKELQPWSVYKISSNTLPCSELIFIVLPAWQGNYEKALSSHINQVLVEAMQAASNSTTVAFASFSAAPFNYPVDFCAHRMISFLTDAASVSLSEDQRGTCAVIIFTDNIECEPMFKEQLFSFGFQCEQPLSKQQQQNNNQPQVITLEGPDYKAFLNQLYDNIHEKPPETEPWQQFLSETNWVLAKPLFVGYLKRVTAILLEDDVTNHLSLSTGKSISILTNLSHANLILSTLYKNCSQSNLLYLHEKIAEDQLFVKCCVKFTYAMLKLSDIKIWYGVSVFLTALISWSLQSSHDLVLKLEKCDALADIMNALQLVSVQDLSQENVLTQLVWLNLLMLYRCATNAHVPSFYDDITGFSNILLNFVRYAPDKEIVIISKSLLTRLLIVGNGTSDVVVLHREEVRHIIYMLKSDLSEPMTVHGLSFITLFSMIMDLAAIDDNKKSLLSHDVLLVIAELIDILPSLEQEAAIKVVSIFLQDNYNISSILLEDPNINIATEEGSFVVSEESILKHHAADYIFDLLLHFITDSLAPCNDHTLDEVAEKLDNLWTSAAVAVSIMRQILSQSDEPIRDSIMQVVSSYPSIFQDLFMIYEIESSHQVMKRVITDVVWFLAVCTDHSSMLAQRCSRSNAVFLPTVSLHAARILNAYDEKIVLFSLHVLLNCALNGNSYPSFNFAETIAELKVYVKLSNFKLAYLAKFILCCFTQYLDCYELLNLKLTVKEADFCIDTLSEAANSADLESETFTAYEMLLILVNFTYPYFLQDSALTKDGHTADPKKSSLFSQNMLATLKVLKENFSLLMADKLFQSIEVLLKSPLEKHIQEKCIQLTWNLSHYLPAKEKIMLEHQEIISAIKVHWKSAYSELQVMSYCVLYLLGEINCDAGGKLKYAESCFLYENYFEVVSVCSEIPLMLNTAEKINQVQLLKGKAMFYMYQPKIFYLMKHRQELQKLEVKLLEAECFATINETIQVLGYAFDLGYLDSEGSKLFDWAMMDCIREINQLNLCRRCLMCRASKNLRRSHIWPKFALQQMSSTHTEMSNNRKSSKKFTFGFEKHKIKSAGECWFWMLCGHCEEIMSQNAENDFSIHFPKEIAPQTVTYDTWFFNYSCAILLRTIAFVKFPRCFNDDEIYYTFVYCRNHLLSLQVRIGGLEADSTKHKLWQYCSKSLDLKPYVFILPSNIIMQETNIVIQPGIASCNWLAPHRLLDGWRDFSGFSHFFAACCNHVCIVIKYSPSSSCYIPERYEIKLTGGTYVIENDHERISAIPNGLWMLWNRMVLLDNESLSGIMRDLSTGAAKKLLSGRMAPMKGLLSNFAEVSFSEEVGDDNAVQVPHPMTSTKQLNFLPAEFMLADAGLCTTQRKINFPEGHQVLCHDNFKGFKESLLCFIGIGASIVYPLDKPYLVFIISSQENKVEYLDGAFLTMSDEGNIQLSEFFLNHEVANVVRSNFGEYHEVVVYASKILLMKFGVGTLPSLLHFLQCRRGIKPRGLPAFACKCSFKGCWYCQDLCHYCLKAGTSSCSLPNFTIRYCNNTCLTLLCTKPKELSKNMLVFTHSIEEDNFSDMSVLDILKIHRCDDSHVNQFELVHICVESCSGNYKPYIIWQKRTLTSQIIPIFYISEDCKFVSLFGDGNKEFSAKINEQFAVKITELVHHHQKKLEDLITTAVQHLGYAKFSAFLSHCFKCLNKTESLQNTPTVGGTCVDQSKEKVLLFVSVINLPEPKIVIPEHFITGMSIINSQLIEIKVDLSAANDLGLNIVVINPLLEEFNLQLQTIDKNMVMGQFIPPCPGEYILHLSLYQSTAIFTKLDACNITVTVF